MRLAGFVFPLNQAYNQYMSDHETLPGKPKPDCLHLLPDNA